MGVEISRVSDQLEQRIQEAKNWAEEGFPGGVAIDRIRKFPIHIKPLQYVQSPPFHEEESGVRFRLAWKGTSGPAWIEVDFLIEPLGCTPIKRPYLALYVHKENLIGDLDLIGFEEIGRENLIPDRTIQNFFTYWLRKWLRREEYASQVFRHKTRGLPPNDQQVFLSEVQEG